MISAADIASDARLYLRPEQFVDSPVARDGQVARLAGGLIWFAAYEVIAIDGNRRITRSSVLVGELPALIAKMPEAQADRVRRLADRITAPRPPLQLGTRTIRFDQPQVMGILNVTPDSFSDGGNHADAGAAARAGFDLWAAGAALVDVGGESTRPGAPEVWEGEEIERVVPVITALAPGGAVSVDTRKAAVMEAALSAGAHLVNDVGALLYDPRAAEVVAAAGCPVVLMHSPDPTKGADGDGKYGDVLTDVFDWLEARVEAAVAAGIDRARILVDPGIGFGKSLADNLALLNGLSLLHGLGVPVVLGASRKRMIGALSNEAAADERLGGSVALALLGVTQGIQMVRVHDVAETVQALRIWRGLRDAALSAIR